jgi:flavodoxin
MKVFVVYDSIHGNTEKIARTVGAAITGDVHVVRVEQAKPSDLNSVDLLIIGSPTEAGRPTRAVRDFVSSMPASAGGGSVAAFDTRFSARWVRVFGYAADRIAATLKGKGWTAAARAEGFFVTGKEGPLKEGELERAAKWARTISESSV